MKRNLKGAQVGQIKYHRTTTASRSQSSSLKERARWERRKFKMCQFNNPLTWEATPLGWQARSLDVFRWCAWRVFITALFQHGIMVNLIVSYKWRSKALHVLLHNSSIVADNLVKRQLSSTDMVSTIEGADGYVGPGHHVWYHEEYLGGTQGGSSCT